MENENPKLPTYQKTIGHALAYSSVKASCRMLEVMHNEGKLDICQRDEHGYNVIDYFLERAPLCEPMLDTLERVGMTAAYTQAYKGRFIAMDRQVKWTQNRGTDSQKRHTTQGAYQKLPENAVARMIDQVDEAWFDVKGHGRGAIQVARLVECPQSAPLALAACWRRGINPNVRKKNSALAVANMTNLETFPKWIQAGGDVLARVSDRKSWPIWQQWADLAHTRNGNNINHSKAIHAKLEGLVDAGELHDACQFMVARYNNTNQSEMIKALNSIPGWMQKFRYTGTPIWMAAVRARPALLENLLDRKRSRPDFTQRDYAGRSIWFSVISSEKEILDKLQVELPIQQFGRDTKGRGLVTQEVIARGGLAGLVGATAYLDGCTRQMLKVGVDERGVFLDGLENFKPEELDGLDKKELSSVAIQLLGRPMISERLRTDTCVRMVDGFLHTFQESINTGSIEEDQKDNIHKFIMQLISEPVELPLEDWIEYTGKMKKTWNHNAESLAKEIHPILQAQFSRVNLQQATKAAQPPAHGSRVGRF